MTKFLAVLLALAASAASFAGFGAAAYGYAHRWHHAVRVNGSVATHYVWQHTTPADVAMSAVFAVLWLLTVVVFAGLASLAWDEAK